MPIELPSPLIERVKTGKVVLFLGAGASMGSISRSGIPCPSAKTLGEIISDKFLGGEAKDQPLSTVVEYAIAMHDLLAVQDYIREFFDGYYPAEFHKKIASFRWAGIFTTNYDLIIERAYEENSERVQDLVPIVKNSDRIDNTIRSNTTVPYNKLHGCIASWDRTEIPLIFTVDQYVDHKSNRDSLFNRLLEYGREYTIVFIGYSLGDHDIREALLELNKNINIRPRYYTITPNVSDFDRAVWSEKRVDPIAATFEEFISALDGSLDETLRALATPVREFEIERKFIRNDDHLSEAAILALDNDCTHLYKGMQIEPCRADDFFKGNSTGWGAIDREYDCKRMLNDTIMSDAVLIDESERPSICDFYFLGGHAGSGKTCSLKRVAWDAAALFEKICIFVESPSRVDLKPIIEIAEKCGERIYVFIDKCSLHVGEILFLHNTAKRLKVPVTIVAAERQNEWNVDCSPLHIICSDQWLLPYLKEKEIRFLLDKLTEYNCLGVLKSLTRQEQENAFREKAGRQLLVALYEVTVSKPFEEIVFDEYKNIEPEKARLIYRTVCALNKWGVLVRSGLIHRIFNINYEEFRKNFFIPLEHIVQTRTSSTSDHSYQARHPHIAEFVFEQALTNQQERFDLILTILSCMDLGYDSDYRAFREIIKARHLKEQFKDPVMIRKIYDQCKEMADDDDFYHQQIAHFEFKRDNPNYTLAEKHLDIAEKLNPSNSSVNHSRSLLQLQRGRNAKGLERQRLLTSADGYARKSVSANLTSGYGYQTICEVAIEKLKDILDSESPDEMLINETVKEIEGKLAVGLQKYPSSEFLLATESKLWELLGENGKAVSALENAFRANDASPYIASALAKISLRKKDISRAREVLEVLLQTQASDKFCNGLLGKILSLHYPDESDRSLLHLRRSFTQGDTNFTNQFWYARQLYINRQFPEAFTAFKLLQTASIDSYSKNTIEGKLKQRGKPLVLIGRIKKLESTYAFIENRSYPGIHFLHKGNVDETEWDRLSVGQEIAYNLGFSFKGPACTDISLPSSAKASSLPIPVAVNAV